MAGNASLLAALSNRSSSNAASAPSPKIPSATTKARQQKRDNNARHPKPNQNHAQSKTWPPFGEPIENHAREQKPIRAYELAA
jgi:hypothetical protein